MSYKQLICCYIVLFWNQRLPQMYNQNLDHYFPETFLLRSTRFYGLHLEKPVEVLYFLNNKQLSQGYSGSLGYIRSVFWVHVLWSDNLHFRNILSDGLSMHGFLFAHWYPVIFPTKEDWSESMFSTRLHKAIHGYNIYPHRRQGRSAHVPLRRPNPHSCACGRTAGSWWKRLWGGCWRVEKARSKQQKKWKTKTRS